MNNKFLYVLKLVIFLLLPLIFLIFYPPFYFNEFENKGRLVYSEIESTNQAIDDNIEQRSGREGGLKSAEEYDYYSNLIIENFSKMEAKIGQHQNLLKKQGKFIFLLSSKYKKYYGYKKEFFEKYYLALKNFKQLKDSENAIMDSLKMANDFSKIMSDIGNTREVNVDTLKNNVEKFKTYQPTLKKHYDNGYLTEKLYKKLSTDFDYFINSFLLIIDWKESKVSNDEFGNKFKQMSENTMSEDVISLINESRKEISNVKENEWKDLYRQSAELLDKALKYYDENHLSEDNLNKILSRFNKNYPKNKAINTNESIEEKQIDLDGDGQQDVLKLFVSYKDEKTPEATVKLIAFDKNNKEIGKLPDDFPPIRDPMSNTARVYTPIKKDKKQFVSFEFIAGPHSSETMFFGLFDLKDGSKGIIPVCLTDEVAGENDCLFWSGEVGELIADDFDKDGVLEVIEIVDEYPKDGLVTEEIEKTVTSVFGELGQKASDGALRVLKREQGGRGNRVIWGIYRYNDNYFEKQLEENYDKYYLLVKDYIKDLYPNYPKLMKRSDLSKDSLEYNEFMRNYWTGGL